MFFEDTTFPFGLSGHGFGPAFVALDRHGELWCVAQAHVGDGDGLRDVVYSVMHEAGLRVE